MQNFLIFFFVANLTNYGLQPNSAKKNEKTKKEEKKRQQSRKRLRPKKTLQPYGPF